MRKAIKMLVNSSLLLILMLMLALPIANTLLTGYKRSNDNVLSAQDMQESFRELGEIGESTQSTRTPWLISH